MTVKELIEKLIEFDKNKEVIASINIRDKALDQDCMNVMEFEDRVVIFTTW